MLKNFLKVSFRITNMRLAFLLCWLLSFPAWGQTGPTAISIGKEYKLSSKILQEERRYLVSLPASYEQDEFYRQKRYPVVVLLDGDTHFQTATGLIKAMSAAETEQIPEMIVVAVPNTNRNRDLTPTITGLSPEVNQPENGTAKGGGAAFLQFLEQELLPQIDKAYRTLPYRVLVGHSMGGLLAADAFLKQRSFHAYLLIDPSLWWNNQIIIQQAKTVLEKNKMSKANFYISQANNPFNEGAAVDAKGKAIQAFVTYLQNNQSESFRVKHDFFPTEDHFSVPSISLYQGLLFLFEGYKFPLNTLKVKSANDVRQHYALFSQRLGVNIIPPGKLVNQVGLFLLYSEKKVDKAIEILKLNETYYPHSAIPYSSLGAAYKIKGDKELALLYYKKALERDTASEKIRVSIQELMQN